MKTNKEQQEEVKRALLDLSLKYIEASDKLLSQFESLQRGNEELWRIQNNFLVTAAINLYSTAIEYIQGE